ncbi:S-adenosyl-L-methionine-dependent methyltransferase, partial [Phialemonium atrogriseum]
MPRLALQSGVVVTKDSIVVLKEPLGRFRIQFLKVQVIIKNRLNGRVRVRGWPYTRARNLDGQLMRKLNEVCLVGHIDEEDPRPWLEQAIIDVYESDIEGLRVGGLRTTNAPFPQFRFGDAAYRLKGKRWVEHHEVLVCRYHHYLVYRDVIKKKLEKAHQWVLIHANEDMSDAEYKVRDMAKTNDWRGGNIPGGSFCPLGFDPEVISIDDDDDEDNKVTLDRNGSDATKADGPNMRKPGQKYTVGDLFSGAGGASRGIQQAGFKLVFAVDHWSVAVTTYRANFPEVDCHLMEVDDFTKDSDINYRVDILHLSPPCQVWSPAHTIAGQNDDKNMAALMSCTEVIEQIRPRLFTLEQTFGMLHTRFELYFNGLVGGFTDHGYSVRWGVINFNTWGLCQPRRRLVMVGACPGQALPDFPSATHSQDGAGGLLPFTTSREALAHLRAGDDLHDVADMPRLWNARSWDPDAPLPHTITCSGGQNHHWGGQRDFTAREYASLQGFPVRHRFRGAYLKRQIGNAFPPSMARRLFGHLRDFLEREDRMVGPREAEHE